MPELKLTVKNVTSARVVYSASRGTVKFARRLFGDSVPDTLVFESDAFAEPKQVLTKEQRAEARKNAPKLTPAEKLAKLEERAARLRASLRSGDGM